MLKNSKSDTTKKITDIACTFFKNAGKVYLTNMDNCGCCGDLKM
jgi:hypothetical protein